MCRSGTHAFVEAGAVGELSPDGTKARAVKDVLLIANSSSAALMEMAREAGPDKPALLNGQCM